MDIHSLQAFLAVAEQESFSHAAEQLYLTQPAISKRIANLESSLNHQLFDRIGRTIHLTEAGRALLPHAQSILLQMEDSKRAINNLSKEVSGELSLGTSHHIGLHRLPEVLRSYTRNHPQVKLNIRFVDSEEAWDGVVSGKMELGIVTLPPKPLQANITQTQIIWKDELKFVIAADHPSLKSGIPSTIKELAKTPALLPTPNTFTRQIVEQLFAKHKLDIDIAVATNYMETIGVMTEIGLGWSVLPKNLISDKLIELPLSDISISRDLGVVYHSKRNLSNAAQSLLNQLESLS